MQDDRIETKLKTLAGEFFERSFEESLVVNPIPVRETIIREVMIKRHGKTELAQKRRLQAKTRYHIALRKGY